MKIRHTYVYRYKLMLAVAGLAVAPSPGHGQGVPLCLWSLSRSDPGAKREKSFNWTACRRPYHAVRIGGTEREWIDIDNEELDKCLAVNLM